MAALAVVTTPRHHPASPKEQLKVTSTESRTAQQPNAALQDEESSSLDVMWKQLHAEAQQALRDEPELKYILQRTVLHPHVTNLNQAVAMTICYRMLQAPCMNMLKDPKNPKDPNNTSLQVQSLQEPKLFCPNSLYEIMCEALEDTTIPGLFLGHTTSEAVRKDIQAVIDRDPACESILEVILFFKGFASLVAYRVAHQKWIVTTASSKRRSLTALFLQSQASAMFGVDIHPAATIGAGVLLDHGTGVVIGETAVVGDGCTLLHAVTLGGTGKEHGDRHPKLGPNVLIGAGAKILGNIQIGAGAKIGAGSVVLRPIPAGATAVGAPAKIIGRALEANPASDPDFSFGKVGMLHKSQSTLDTELMMGGKYESSEENYDSSEDFSSSADHTNQNNLKNQAILPEETTPADNEKEDPPLIANASSHGKQMLDKPNSSHHLSSSSHHRKKKATNDDEALSCFCPFRDYTRMAQSAPKGSITIVNLGKVLKKYGCTAEEVGCTIFELDDRNVGHVYWEDVTGKEITKEGLDDHPSLSRLQESLQTNTRLDPSQLTVVMEELRRVFAAPTASPE